MLQYIKKNIYCLQAINWWVLNFKKLGMQKPLDKDLNMDAFQKVLWLGQEQEEDLDMENITGWQQATEETNPEEVSEEVTQEDWAWAEEDTPKWDAWTEEWTWDDVEDLLETVRKALNITDETDQPKDVEAQAQKVDDAKVAVEQNPTDAKAVDNLKSEINKLKEMVFDKDLTNETQAKEIQMLRTALDQRNSELWDIEQQTLKNKRIMDLVNSNENIKNLATMMSAVAKWDESAKDEVANILEDLSKEVFWVSIKDVLKEKEQQQSDLIEAEDAWASMWWIQQQKNTNGRDVIPNLEGLISKMM